MKKTYTACFILCLAGLLYYGELTGRTNGACTRHAGYGALASNPASCSVSGCHSGGVAVLGHDSTGSAGTATAIYDITFAQGIAAYPTVTSDVINIETSAASSELRYDIYGLDGRRMLSGSLPSYPAFTSVDVRSLAPAHYVVRVADASHSTRFRIVKQ